MRWSKTDGHLHCVCARVCFCFVLFSVWIHLSNGTCVWQKVWHCNYYYCWPISLTATSHNLSEDSSLPIHSKCYISMILWSILNETRFVKKTLNKHWTIDTAKSVCLCSCFSCRILTSSDFLSQCLQIQNNCKFYLQKIRKNWDL